MSETGSIPSLESLAGAGKQAGLIGFTTLERPEWVPVERVSHVRDDDLCFAFVVGDAAYCVPFFVVDYYHTVNTELAGEPAMLVSCDRCATSGAWRARARGTALTFRNWGILEAQLVLRDVETDSIWFHSDASCVAGDLAGSALEPLSAVVQTLYGDWRGRHHDSLVLTGPAEPDALHRDLRHGHGREEFFERRGIGAHEHEYFLETITRAWDTRLPEEEMVLGVSVPGAAMAFPWRDLKHEGGVVNTRLGDVPIVAWCDPTPAGFTCAAFDRRLDGSVLEFTVDDGALTDTASRSPWTLEGRCIGGRLEGRDLRPLRTTFKRWFGWAPVNPDAPVLRTRRRVPEESGWGLVEADLAPILDELRNHGAVSFYEEVVTAALPQGCRRGVRLRVEGHPFVLWSTAGAHYARDLAVLSREWLVPMRAVSAGAFVLEDGCDRWTDWTHTAVASADKIRWSQLLDRPEVRDGFARACNAAEPTPPTGTALVDVMDRLEEREYRIDTATRRLLPRSAREPRCEGAAEFRIGDDRWILYRYDSPVAAMEAAERFGHSLAAEAFVLRSTPLNMYRVRAMELALRPDHAIHWSSRLTDPAFRRAFSDAVGGAPTTS